MLGERGRRLLRIADLQAHKERSVRLLSVVQGSANARGESSHTPPRERGKFECSPTHAREAAQGVQRWSAQLLTRVVDPSVLPRPLSRSRRPEKAMTTKPLVHGDKGRGESCTHPDHPQ